MEIDQLYTRVELISNMRTVSNLFKLPIFSILLTGNDSRILSSTNSVGSKWGFTLDPIHKWPDKHIADIGCPVAYLKDPCEIKIIVYSQKWYTN